MMKFQVIGVALALAMPATAYAAADCCKDKTCCKDSADCCDDKKIGPSCCDRQHDEHAGHDKSAAPAK